MTTEGQLINGADVYRFFDILKPWILYAFMYLYWR